MVHVPFGYGLIFCPFKAEERVRVPLGVPVSGSSVARERRSDSAEAGGSIPPRTTMGGLAQLGERLPCKQEARGSTPLFSTRTTTCREACQNGSAARC